MSTRKKHSAGRVREESQGNGIRVRCSLDVAQLEHHLIERIASRPHGGLLDPVLVLVPTRQLVRYLKRKIVLRVGSALGVHLMTHRALAVQVLEHALQVPPRLLGRAILSAMVDVLAGEHRGADGDYLRSWRGARKALLSTFRDLREAGVLSADLEALPRGDQGPPAFLPELYARYCRCLERLESRGMTDNSGLIRAALPHVPGFLRTKGIRTAFHHGAYELIGVHLELLEAVAEAAVTEFLLPTEVDGPAFGYAARFVDLLRARGAVLEPAEPPADSGREEWIRRIRTLHDNSAPPRDGRFEGSPALEIRHAQGAEAEIRIAALRARTLHEEDGIPLEEIVVVARSLEPYEPFLEMTFRELGIPFSTSVTTPLLRQQAVSAFLCLLGVLAEDLPRGSVVDLLRHAWICLPGQPGPEGGLETDRWDRWSRSARVVSGIDTWRALPGWVESEDLPGASEAGNEPADSERAAERARSAAKLLEILEALESERERWSHCSTLEEHARFLRGLAAKYIRPETAVDAPGAWKADVPVEEEGEASDSYPAPSRPHGTLDRLLRQLEIADPVAQVARSVSSSTGNGAASPVEVLELILSVARAEEVAPGGQDPAGVRILDVMQARGLSHRVVLWIGFHHGLFPRHARPDPYLDDAARTALVTRTGRPLALRSGSQEERLLLAMGLAAARDRFALSFQRADESGRACARSGALREVARVYLGRADTRRLLEDTEDNPCRPERISSHPGERARNIATSPHLGRLPPADAVVAGAVRSVQGTKMAARLLRELSLEDAVTGSALRCVEAIERFEAPQTDFDGWTEVGIPEGSHLSPTAFERLARCPLAFFLRHLLHLRELDEEAMPHRIEVRALGIAVHATLAEIYGQLDAEGCFRQGSAPVQRALELLGAAWRTQVRKAAGPSHERLRGLFTILGAQWLEALEGFVREDLETIHAAGFTAVEVERTFESALPSLGSIIVTGRLDRVLRGAESAMVDDYKTGGNVANRLKKTQILRGLQIQLPLYLEVAAAVLGLPIEEVRARLLGVGPEIRGKETRVELKLNEEHRGGFLETVGISADLALRGRFPLWPSSPSDVHYCGYCGYRKTCRRLHEPTLERLERDPELADFRDARGKTSRKGMGLLDGVRAAAGTGRRNGEEES